MPLFFFSLSLIAILFYTQVEVGTSVVCPLFQGYCHAYRPSWLELPSQRWGPQSKQPINVLSVFLQKKYSAARGLLFIFLWCPFYFARLIGFFSFLWFVHVLVIVLKRLHIGIWFDNRNFFICFHAVFFLYIRNSADIFYTPTATSLWSKMNPSKKPTFWLCLNFFQDFFI